MPDTLVDSTVDRPGTGELSWEHWPQRESPRTVWRVVSHRLWNDRDYIMANWFADYAEALRHMNYVEREGGVVSVARYDLIVMEDSPGRILHGEEEAS